MSAALAENSPGLSGLLQRSAARAGRRVRHARRGPHQVDELAALEREIHDLLLLDGILNGGRFDLQ